jgi:hypothetical protein
MPVRFIIAGALLWLVARSKRYSAGIEYRQAWTQCRLRLDSSRIKFHGRYSVLCPVQPVSSRWLPAHLSSIT